MIRLFALMMTTALATNWLGGTGLPLLPAAGSPIPAVEGDYPDADHPGVRVHVFVHEPRDGGGLSLLSAVLPTACTDPDSTAVVPAAGWRLPAGTWRYRLNTSSVPASVGAAALPSIAANGYGRWQAAQSKVAFSRGADTSVARSAADSQNVIAWGRTSGNALAVTYVRYFTSTGIVVDVDTIVNKRVAWSWTPYAPGTCGDAQSYDAQAVLTHEQGHWLGLDDVYTSAYVNNTMYGMGTPGDLKADTLTAGDKAGAAAIYP